MHVLKHEPLHSSTEYVHLLNALCWNYTRDDHSYLVSLDVFKTIQCGDGTLMHPIFRSWGQEDTNFHLHLEKETQLSLTSRLRQVFEFLVHTIIESLFVKREDEKLNLGDEDAVESMLSTTGGQMNKASEKLLQIICDILFANTHRYLRMKTLFNKDYFEQHVKHERFEMMKDESDEGFEINSRCPRDLANYINSKGGLRLLKAKQQLQGFMNDMKAQMLIAQLMDAGQLDSESALASRVRLIADKSLTGADKALANATHLIISRDYRTMAAIKKSSWEALGLEQP